jgi:hypothetical protein
MGPLGAYFRTGYSLSEREREIAVVIINSKRHSIYPTNAQERAGKAAGLPADKVEALLSGVPTSFSDTREQVVCEMATCLANSRWVAKGLYDRAVEALGHVGITDDLPDGLLHRRLDDPGLLRRARRGDRHGALSNLARREVEATGANLSAPHIYLATAKLLTFVAALSGWKVAMSESTSWRCRMARRMSATGSMPGT